MLPVLLALVMEQAAAGASNGSGSTQLAGSVGTAGVVIIEY